MGKRKSSKPPPKAVRAKLETTFSCPFCNTNKAVTALLDHEREVGTVSCNSCHENFSCKIDSLSEPIDVYSEWIDACENENK